eukprot:TRINITY_DN17278_c0_g1_i2.p1 TRINITY_DN17278_c0_g1~~TRINITY_DN17278_c0_g1_i2.p1  ORF type:complete len:505 (+),score=95.50 TRINITY_DN17278_c0_g1_i2:170-1684(+)
MQTNIEFDDRYDISATAAFIHRRGFCRVALQFPDELLHVSVKVVKALRKELDLLKIDPNSKTERVERDDAVKLYIMADTTYSSCCVDEVAAEHVNAECVIHYGHACFSPTSKLPSWFVFGKSCIEYKSCANELVKYSSSIDKPLLVLFSLESAYVRQLLKQEVEAQQLTENSQSNAIHFAEVLSPEMDPLLYNIKDFLGMNSKHTKENDNFEYRAGGLRWFLPRSQEMEKCALIWIGPECAALTNIMLTYSRCTVARYDADKNCLFNSVPNQEKILKRRYYLVERARDAEIVGIVVGTLGIAGYQEVLCCLKKLLKNIGKKSYTFVMGKPNPAKLANFPECNIFVYVACSETALLDSKDFLSPLITPYEAVLAFTRGSQWTGSYYLDFSTVLSISETVDNRSQEAHFSFLKGGYVATDILEDDMDVKEGRIIPSGNADHGALELADNSSNPVALKVAPKSGSEFLSMRSFQGLEITQNKVSSYSYIKGRSGRAWSYDEEGKLQL